MVGSVVLSRGLYLYLSHGTGGGRRTLPSVQKRGRGDLERQYAHRVRAQSLHDNSPSIATIAYPMVADPTARLCRYFGTYIEDVGLSLRGTLIIDPDGVLKAMDVHGNSIGRSAEEILRKLQAASFVRQHQGEVCPASWKPGKKILKPGLELVGKL